MFEFRVKRSLTFWSRRRASSCGNIDEAVQDGHSLVGDTSIGVNLLEDLYMSWERQKVELTTYLSKRR